MEIEEKYEKIRKFQQFSKWSDKVDSSMKLPVLDSKQSSWLIPVNRPTKKLRKDLDTKVQEDQNVNLSRTEKRRIKELKEKLNKKNIKKNDIKKDRDDSNKYLIKKPRDVANLCESVMSDPENNIEYLYLLLEYCEKRFTHSRNIKNLQDNNFPIELSIISLILVIKDLTPGYRISNQIIALDDNNDDKIALKKRTQKIHSFERKIMNLYKRTCLFLKKFLNLGKVANLSKSSGAILKSAMNLLDSTYHFNHHIILLRMIILFLMSAKDSDEDSCLSYCSEGIANILLDDTTLEVGVESVNIIQEALFNKNIKKKGNKYSLNKWILYPFTKYSPWNRIEESKNEYRRIFGSNKSNITDEIIDELQHTSGTRIKAEILAEREEQILKHLFSFYAKVLLLDNCNLEHVYLGISHYSNRINPKIRSELISLIKEKLSKSESLKWNEFLVILKCCFSLIQKGSNLTELQLEDNSWVLRYLVLKFEKERLKIKKMTGSSEINYSDYLSDIEGLRNKELTNIVLSISIFSCSNSSYLYRLLFSITETSLYFSKINESELSLILLKLCGQLLIKYPRLRILLDPEGIPCNEFPIDANCISLSWNYQEISLYYILQDILKNPNIDLKLKLACNLLLSESCDDLVRKNAIFSIKSIEKNKSKLIGSSSTEEIKPLYYILKLIDI